MNDPGCPHRYPAQTSFLDCFSLVPDKWETGKSGKFHNEQKGTKKGQVQIGKPPPFEPALESSIHRLNDLWLLFASRSFLKSIMTQMAVSGQKINANVSRTSSGQLQVQVCLVTERAIKAAIS